MATATKQTNKKRNFLFGTDPEFALRNLNNQIVSAIPVLNRSKHDPIDLRSGHKIYFDNVLVEANIAPAKNKGDLLRKLKSLYRKSQKVLNGHKLSATASHDFDPVECMHDEAMKFGCDPELDVYEGRSAYPPQGVGQFRSAGGHIHIGGITNKTVYEKSDLVVLMDILVGIPAVIMDNDPTSVARKQLYGKAGRFRNTNYGIEYRTLGNFWLSNPELASVIYDLTILAAKTWENDEAAALFALVDQEQVINAINNGDKELAKTILDKLPIEDNLKNRIVELSNNAYDGDIFKNWAV